MKPLPKYNLEKTQIYPLGSNFYESIKDGLKINFENLSLSELTSYASIGTCFAEEFSTYLKENNIGKYITLEDNPWNSSAFWGRVYTIGNLLQIIHYSTDQNYPIFIENTSKGYIDPLRDGSVPSEESIESINLSINDHRFNSRQILNMVDILVITLGQNETWFDSKLDIVWGSIPPTELRLKENERFSPIEYTYRQNFNNLKEIISILTKFNPELKILLTVSPVPAYATFLNESIIPQSFAGKCILRSVVNEIIQEYSQRVFYFPSFEMALCDNISAFKSDNRHVKRGRVDRIFKVFSLLPRRPQS
jgi:hypothetical protein